MGYVRLEEFCYEFNGYDFTIVLYRYDDVYKIFCNGDIVFESEIELSRGAFDRLCKMFVYAFSEGYGCGESDEYFRSH